MQLQVALIGRHLRHIFHLTPTAPTKKLVEEAKKKTKEFEVNLDLNDDAKKIGCTWNGGSPSKQKMVSVRPPAPNY